VDQCGGDGSCNSTVIPGCVRCTTAAECDDGNACTEDACLGPVCSHSAIPGCAPCVPSAEVCGDGSDNDCDALADCSDPDCAGAPACLAPTAEVCGNCADDDRDGLLDGEDPDCCATAMALTVDRFLIRPPEVKVRGDRLRLSTTWASASPPLFDPLRQDTTVELADGGGPLLRHDRRTALAPGTPPELSLHRPRRRIRRRAPCGEFRIARSGTSSSRPAGGDDAALGRRRKRTRERARRTRVLARDDDGQARAQGPRLPLGTTLTGLRGRVCQP
jgi:hypothetical protein